MERTIRKYYTSVAIWLLTHEVFRHRHLQNSIVKLLLWRDFTLGTKPMKSLNRLNTIKPWTVNLQRRMGPQPKTISEHKIHKKRSGANRAPEFIVSVAEVVKEHLSKSTRKITQEIGTIRRTTWRIVKVERNYKSC